jgi:hypothetical protein
MEDYSGLPKTSWPPNVRPMTIDETGLLGIRDRDGQLFWNGREIQTRKKVTLRGFELSLAVVVAVATLIGSALSSWEWLCHLAWIGVQWCPK